MAPYEGAPSIERYSMKFESKCFNLYTDRIRSISKVRCKMSNAHFASCLRNASNSACNEQMSVFQKITFDWMVIVKLEC